MLYSFLVFRSTSVADYNRTHPDNFLVENGQLNAPPGCLLAVSRGTVCIKMADNC